MDEAFYARLKSLKSSIPRPKTPEEKRETSKALENEDWAPEVRLRGYLSIRRLPPPSLLTNEIIMGALNQGDCATFLPLLYTKQEVIDNGPALLAFRKLLQSDKQLKPLSVIQSLHRAARKWQPKNRTTLATENGTRWLLELLTDALGTVEKAPRLPPNRSLVKAQAQVIEVLKLCLRWSLLWRDASIRQAVTTLLSTLEKSHLLDFNEVLATDGGLAEQVENVGRAALLNLRELATEGRAAASEELANSLSRLRCLGEEPRKTVEALFAERERYQEDVQLAITRLARGESSERRAATITLDDSQKIENVQLASALLRAWDARADGQHAAEAFTELRTVVRDFFGMELGGEVGQVQDYNPRVHEFAHGELPTLKVRVLRPWVAVHDGEILKLIVKALVSSEA